MNKKQIIGMTVAAALFIIIGVSSVISNTFSQKSLEKSMEEAISLTGGFDFDAPIKDYIAVVDVVGTIQEDAPALRFHTQPMQAGPPECASPSSNCQNRHKFSQ